MAAPTVTSVTPSTGVSSGGEVVSIVGTGFSAATAVRFGSSAALDFVVISATSIAAVTPAHDAGAVTVYVTNADGTSTDAITFTYSSSAGLFTVAEALAFSNARLPATTPSADIIACEQRIREAFETICNVAFVSASYSEYLDGDGTKTLLVTKTRPTAITAAVVYDSDGVVSETFDADDLADCAVYLDGRIVRKTNGIWLYGEHNCYLTYPHGYTSVPTDIKRAGLILCVNELTFSNISDRTTSFSDGSMNYQLATAGRGSSYFGLPLVDSVLGRYNHNIPSIA